METRDTEIKAVWKAWAKREIDDAACRRNLAALGLSAAEIDTELDGRKEAREHYEQDAI